MIKEFEIKDILSAVNNISKTSKKNKIIKEEKISIEIKGDLNANKQTNTIKSEILVLDQMIE
jgi:hypothetical protein